LRIRGIDRTEFISMHDQLDVVEDSLFVNNGRGYDLEYSPGMTILKRTKFFGTDPAKGGLDSFGIGGNNHIAGFLQLKDVTIDGYRTGCRLPPRGLHRLERCTINGIHKLIVPYPWGGKVEVADIKFGSMPGEDAQPIEFGTDPTGPWLYGVPPYSNWTRKFQPFEFIYNGQRVYHDDQRADAVPFDSKQPRWANATYGALHHGVLEGLSSRALWDKHRLAIGGRLAPEKLTPCADIKGGSIGEHVAFDPPLESEPSTAMYGGQRYEALIGKAGPATASLHPRYLYDPILVQTPQKGYVAKVCVAGKEYQSAATDLAEGINLVPIAIGDQTRNVVVGSPSRQKSYQNAAK
jgi:hypothetical protein